MERAEEDERCVLGALLEITEEQKRRAQINKEKALALKEKKRPRGTPYDRHANQESLTPATPSSSRDPLPKLVSAAPSRNSYAGFMYDEETDSAQQHKYRLVEEDGMWWPPSPKLATPSFRQRDYKLVSLATPLALCMHSATHANTSLVPRLSFYWRGGPGA
jgi:hypothetical protein